MLFKAQTIDSVIIEMMQNNPQGAHINLDHYLGYNRPNLLALPQQRPPQPQPPSPQQQLPRAGRCC